MRTHALLLVGLFAVGAANADQVFDKKVSADPHGTVEISNVAGRIEVSGWDNPEVDVHADMGAGVDRVDVESDHGRTTIKVIVPNHSFRSISTNLRVRVPRDSELDVSGVSSDVGAADVQGVLQLKTVSGDIKADVFQRNVDVKTVSGDVTLRGKGQQGAMLHLSSISGNIHVDRAAGDVEATTVSGDLTLRLESARNVRVRTTSGDLTFESKLVPGAMVDGETVSGDLTVRAVPDGALDYEVATFSGDIVNCMGGDAERVSKYAPGKRLTGSKGQSSGGAMATRIRLKTMSGDVELCDRN